uniref:Uncharacterized protein n=1 Tax=Mesocestoides corti TaxID=53468 RepID=A0A5K3FL95_MESCO
MTMRHESWNRFCQNTSNRLAIEALQLFKAHLNDNRQDDQPGCGREFLDSICLGIRKKFELSLSQRYFVPKEETTKFSLLKCKGGDSLHQKQPSKADEAGEAEQLESEAGTTEKESSLAASSSLSLIGESGLSGGGGGGGGHHHQASYVNASTVVAAALAAAAAQRSATKASCATAPLPCTAATTTTATTHHHHKAESRWRPGSWLRRSFVLLWRRRTSPSIATATSASVKPIPQDDVMSIIAYHQSKASRQCRQPGANILLLGECVLEGVLTEWLGPGGVGGGGGGGVNTPPTAAPPPSASSTSSAFSVPGLLVLQDNPQWARSRVLLMRTSAGYVLEVYTPPE